MLVIVVLKGIKQFDREVSSFNSFEEKVSSLEQILARNST